MNKEAIAEFSSTTITRLLSVWQDEYKSWRKRPFAMDVLGNGRLRWLCWETAVCVGCVGKRPFALVMMSTTN